MEQLVSNDPNKTAGAYVSDWIEAQGGSVLCLLSGGSALEIIPHIKLAPEAKVRTIFIMGDERWSREPTINNYLQLQSVHPEFVNEHTIINTVPEEGEDLNSYATRISANVQNFYLQNGNVRVIAILGIGTDGHTAGIFPMEESAFTQTYAENRFYSPIMVENEVCPYRASVTPKWLTSHVSKIVLYGTGGSKRLILTSLVGTDVPEHQMPAQIVKRHTDSILIRDQDLN